MDIYRYIRGFFLFLFYTTVVESFYYFPSHLDNVENVDFFLITIHLLKQYSKWLPVRCETDNKNHINLYEMSCVLYLGCILFYLEAFIVVIIKYSSAVLFWFGW